MNLPLLTIPELYRRPCGDVNLREKLPDVSPSSVRLWRRPQKPGTNMDRLEIVASRASGEADFLPLRGK